MVGLWVTGFYRFLAGAHRREAGLFEMTLKLKNCCRVVSSVSNISPWYEGEKIFLLHVLKWPAELHWGGVQKELASWRKVTEREETEDKTVYDTNIFCFCRLHFLKFSLKLRMDFPELSKSFHNSLPFPTSSLGWFKKEKWVDYTR